jgi:RsiW-degrading membrane proteinase PrsW (M82 family)
MEKEVYNLKTLFFPRLTGRPFREKLAILMLNPLTWLLEASLGLVFMVLCVMQAKATAPHFALWILLATSVAVTVFPFIYIFFMWLIDIFEREPFRFIISLFMWGIASTSIAFIVNTFFDYIILIVFTLITGEETARIADIFAVTVVVAPIAEECIKGFGLIIIAGHHELDDTYDGILYGFAVGVGFAAAENLLYFTRAFEEGQTSVTAFLSHVIYRSIICMLGHGCFTATTGMVIGFFKGRGKFSKYAQLWGIVGLIGAIILHSIFNFSAIGQGICQQMYFEGLQYPVPLFHGPLILVMTFIYFIIIILALIESWARVRRENAYEKERKSGKIQKQKITCSFCGANLSSGDIFCGDCGRKVN